MTPDEAFQAVLQALADRSLPGNLGLVHARREFIVCLTREHRWAAGPVAELLEAMGCETAVNLNGHARVTGKVTGKLLPCPPLPPLEVSSADCCSAAEGAAEMIEAKRCRGPCGRVKLLEEFSLNGRTPQGKQRRMHFCKPDDAARQDALRKAKAGR